MNLHDTRLTFISDSNWVWFRFHGANGRYLGTHLWQVEAGRPPTAEENPIRRPAWRPIGQWTPPRFFWRPWADISPFANGYRPPLCGHQSRSEHPLHDFAYAPGCSECARIAEERGIIAVVHHRDFRSHPRYITLQEDMRHWEDAGSPDD